MTTLKTFAAATLALAAAATPLTAVNASEARSVTISYADLNLASEKGQAVFDRRIETAIEKVCGELENRPTFDSAVHQCRSETRIVAMKSRDLAVANYGNQQFAEAPRELRVAAR